MLPNSGEHVITLDAGERAALGLQEDENAWTACNPDALADEVRAARERVENIDPDAYREVDRQLAYDMAWWKLLQEAALQDVAVDIASTASSPAEGAELYLSTEPMRME